MRKLRIIYTGGTAGGKQDTNGEVIEQDFKRKKFIELLFKKDPSLKNDLEKEKVEISYDTPILEFSENIIPTDWIKIANSVNNAIKDKVDSIVIVHGTDTMCYTSSALSFMLQGIKIPVVITGSNLPLNVERTDLVTNMHDAIKVALDNQFKGVYLVFSGIENKPSDIHLGCKVRKMKFYDNCFKSVNTDMIGKVQRRYLFKKRIKIVNHRLLSRIIELNEKRKYELNTNINPKIAFFKVYPGFNPDLIDYVIEKKETKGIILELYNLGTGCIKEGYSLLKSIENAREIPVFITSQHEGIVTMKIYDSAIELNKKAGAIPLGAMITEAAIPKLMWVLGQTSSKKEITEMMLDNLCGEMEAQ